MNIKFLFVISAILGGAFSAYPQEILSWQFDSTAFVVQPTDQILLTATVSNSSAEPYFIQGGGASFTGDLQYHYQVSWLLDIYGKIVPAEGTLQFDFCTLTPIGGYVEPGIYVADPVSNPAAINFAGVDDIRYLLPSQNFFQITVAVPEPSIVCLSGVSLAFLFVSSSRRHKVFNGVPASPDKTLRLQARARRQSRLVGMPELVVRPQRALWRNSQ